MKKASDQAQPEMVGADNAADFQKQLDEFKASITAEYEDRLAAAEDQSMELTAQVEALRTQQAADGDEPEVELELAYDPFDSQNGLAFKNVELLNQYGDPFNPPEYEVVTMAATQKFPEGQVLGWKSPRQRSDTGWKGWIPFRYGDEYTGENGELLSEYMVDPPMRGEGENGEAIDLYVRRKGLILARLDKRMWDARNRKRELKNAQQMGANLSAKTTVISDGVEIVGEGMKRQQAPASGFKMGEKPVLRPGAHRTELLPHNRPSSEE